MENGKKPIDPTLIEPMTLEDTSVVAWLKMKGWKVIPWIEVYDDPSQPVIPCVVFDVEGDRKAILLEIQNFYNNEKCGIQDFCRNLKEVKSAMYNLRKTKLRKAGAGKEPETGNN
jgi:hypothetical protein